MDILLETHRLIRLIIAPPVIEKRTIWTASDECMREGRFEELRAIITTCKIK